MKAAGTVWDAVNAVIASGDLAARNSEKYVQLQQASQLRILPIRWLWKGWLALGKMHVVAGAPGTGKTTIAMAFAAVVSAGGEFPSGDACKPAKVLIWTGEDDPADTLAPRLLASGANLENVYFVSGTVDENGHRTFDPGSDFQLLLQRAKEIGDVKLLVVDPIVSAVVGDGHKANDVRRGLQPLVALAQELDCAVIGISHFSKGTAGRDPLERVTGSQAFGALARIVIVAAKESSEDENVPARRFIALAKSNISPDGGGFDYDLESIDLESNPGVSATRVNWRGAIVGTARQLLGNAETDDADPNGKNERDDAKAFLLSILSDGPVSVQAIKSDASGAGYAWRTIERAKKDAGIEARKKGLKDGWIWALPGE